MDFYRKMKKKKREEDLTATGCLEILIGLLASQFFLIFKSNKFLEDFFRNLVPSGDVDRITIVNKRALEVYLKEDSLKQKTICRRSLY